MTKTELKEYYEQTAGRRLKWLSRNRYYHRLLERYFSFIVPPGKKILEIGCGPGDLLAAVRPSYGVGIDWSAAMVQIAAERHPELKFVCQDAETVTLPEKFDYIILSDLVGSLWDIHSAFGSLGHLCHDQTRIVISMTSYLWEPMFWVGERIGIKQKQPIQNWLSPQDIANLLMLNGLEPITRQRKILIPKWIPGITWFANRFLANLPVLRHLSLVRIITARPVRIQKQEKSVSVVIPARNEKGNIEPALKLMPAFGSSLEIIFAEGNSSDGTWEEMIRVQQHYKDHNIKVIKQSGKGKGNAVREAFDVASGDVLMILDADLTVPPEQLPKFYEAITTGRGEFINGSRLVYPMEKQAMRTLNLIANKFFGLFFSYLLGQPVKDTLCGTKVLYRSDYETIRENRSYFGNFDPFGDFDLLFGASKANLKIVDMPVRYKERVYGSTQISRFRHGLLLFRMSMYAARKIRFI